jgi:hypothetical protein
MFSIFFDGNNTSSFIWNIYNVFLYTASYSCNIVIIIWFILFYVSNHCNTLFLTSEEIVTQMNPLFIITDWLGKAFCELSRFHTANGSHYVHLFPTLHLMTSNETVTNEISHDKWEKLVLVGIATPGK